MGWSAVRRGQILKWMCRHAAMLRAHNKCVARQPLLPAALNSAVAQFPNGLPALQPKGGAFTGGESLHSVPDGA
jgi:hypothetical protein